MDAPARSCRLHAGAREGLARERRLDARLMQLITEQVEHVYADVAEGSAVERHKKLRQIN